MVDANNDSGNSWIDLMCSKLESDNPRTTPPEAIARFREIILAHCGAHFTQISSPVLTNIDVSLLSAWRKASSDPGHAVIDWLVEGAPAGISLAPESCGIFPDIGDHPEFPHDEVVTGHTGGH